MGKSKKILLFSTAFRPLVGGSEIAIEEVGKRLNGLIFFIVTPKYFNNNRSEASGNFFVHRIGFGSYIDKFIFPLTGFFKGLALIKKEKIGVVHAYQASFGGGAAFLLKIFVPSIKLIVTIQEGKDLSRQSWLIKLGRYLILRKADAITAISSYLADFARRINPRAKIELIPNGVDTDQFSKVSEFDTDELCSKLGLSQNDIVIITVSRLVKKNNVMAIVESMPRILNNFSAKLLIIGTGELEAKLKIKIEKLKLQETVLMLGSVNYGLLPKYLSLGDVFVRPSLSEGLGNAFLEAMAIGLLVIGTPVGGIPDFLKDGVTGFMWDSAKESLADLMVKVLTDSERTKKVAASGREFVVNNYSWDSIAEKFENLYDKYAD